MESVHMHVRKEKIKSPVEEWEAWSRSKHSVKPIFWSSDVNSRLIGKVPDAGKD